MASKAPQTLPRALSRARCSRTRPTRRRIATAAAVDLPEREPFLPRSVPPISPPAQPERKDRVRDAKPFSDFLTDNFNRQHDYLRISVTERCNLRCLYCMPEEGVQLSPNKDVLTSAEIYYLSALFVNQGVNKIRLTGGEPTVRKDIVPLMQQIGSLRRNGLKELALTTNGISLHRKLDQMVEAGLTGVNISLDTLDPFQFQLLTRRQGFDAVMKSINRVQEMNKMGAGVKLKINCVAMRGLNDHQILPFVEMTRDQDVEVRFIEYMPFGGNKWSQNKMLPYAEMLDMIREKYPTVARMRDAKNDTSKTWHVPGFKGRVGFITSMTHNFCGSCNRLRITSDGNLKVCLHGNTEVSLRDLLRKDQGGEPMDDAAFDAIRQIELDRRKHSDLHFGGEEGWMTKERQLLDVIGAAVKRKQEKHAGMGELENMTNRPMILIGERRKFGAASQLSHTPDRSLRPSSPWSRVPSYLLAVPNSGTTHVRCYSSDSRDFSNGDSDSRKPVEQPASGFASTFGFQSLTGLFQQPPQGRYSRPREPEVRPEATPQPEERTFRRKLSSDVLNESLLRPSSHGSQTSARPLAKAAQGDGSSTFYTPRQVAAPVTERTSSESDNRSRDIDKPRVGRIRGIIRDQPYVRKHASDIMQGKRPFPFANASADQVGRRVSPAPDVERPWGLSQDDQDTVDSITDPANSAAPVIPPDSESEGESEANDSHDDRSRLTHVTPSGEAHMVDVGAKAATRRIAIAGAVVRFSNPEPFRLIFENANKKGDVLGVARVAGIMAAKRTSDLIPLCHPLAISKVEVDVKLEAPGATSELWSNNKHGLVNVEALVECVGPTGVEMEALTAATGAALTVYDMCKAVDRSVDINNVSLRYKSGGNSGTFINHRWLGSPGRREWVDQKGLEMPKVPKVKGGNNGSLRGKNA